MNSKISNLNIESFFTNLMVTLTSKKIFYYFLISLIVGSISIYLDWHPILIASACIIIYSIILAFAQNRYFVALTNESKDSPYFLGFLFTYIAVLNIFLNLSDNIQIAFLVSQIGSKLLTTILGLVFRQYILSTDPVTEHHDRIFQQATEELKENVSAYRIAQEKLVYFIDDFTLKQKEIMELTQKAAADHLGVLTETTSAITKYGRQYAPKIQKMLVALEEVLLKLEDIGNKTIPELDDSIREKMNHTMEKESRDFSQNINEVFKVINSTIENLLRVTGLLVSPIENLSRNLSECDNFVHENIYSSIGQIQQKLSDSVKVIDAMNKNTELSFNTTGICFDRIQEQISMVGTAAERMTNVNMMRMETFEKEIKQIDKLIDEFIQIVKKRYSN